MGKAEIKIKTLRITDQCDVVYIGLFFIIAIRRKRSNVHKRSKLLLCKREKMKKFEKRCRFCYVVLPIYRERTTRRGTTPCQAPLYR